MAAGQPTNPARRTIAAPTRVVGQPHAGLRRVVLGGYTGVTSSSELHEVTLPATAAIPLVVKLADSAHRPDQFVAGPIESAQHPVGECSPAYLELWLAPVAAYTILGLPLEHLGYLDLQEPLGSAGRHLGDRIRDADTWSSRFRVLDAFLLDRLQTGPPPAPEVRHAWHRLRATRGSAPIRSIAREVGWSHKHLISRFRQQLGLTPKRAAAIVRFDGLLRELRGATKPDWGRLAAETGYVDQPHLIHDFKRFTGESPTRFLAGTTVISHPVLGASRMM